MKLTTGIDAVEIDRIEKSMQNRRFLEKVLSKEEIAYFEQNGMKAESVAASFCSKEAFGKALGTGISGFEFYEVGVLHDELGKPYLKLSGDARKIADSHGLQFELSITHTKTLAMAVVIAFKD